MQRFLRIATPLILVSLALLVWCESLLRNEDATPWLGDTGVIRFALAGQLLGTGKNDSGHRLTIHRPVWRKDGITPPPSQLFDHLGLTQLLVGQPI